MSQETQNIESMVESEVIPGYLQQEAVYSISEKDKTRLHEISKGYRLSYRDTTAMFQQGKSMEEITTICDIKSSKRTISLKAICNVLDELGDLEEAKQLINFIYGNNGVLMESLGQGIAEEHKRKRETYSLQDEIVKKFLDVYQGAGIGILELTRDLITGEYTELIQPEETGEE